MWFRIDGWLFLAQIGLVILGLAVVGSVAPTLFFTQAMSVLVGLAVSLFLARVDYRVYSRMAWFLYVFCLVGLVLPLLLGFSARGATRWLKIGDFSLQPSEIVKPFLILVFASFFGHGEGLSWRKLGVGVGLLVIPVFLIFVQPDLGSCLVLIFFWLGIVLMTGVPKSWLLGGVVLLLLVSPVGWHFLRDYQKERIRGFLDVQSDPLGTGYHLIQSKVAVGSGQLWGRGLGRGTQSHLRFLPERQTDFIFASLAEELGFIGGAVVVLLFGLLLGRILQVTRRSRDQYGGLIGTGVFSLIFGQMAINLGFNLGFLPVTGITLPLMSYGGSSILAVMISLGLVQSVARWGRRQEAIEIR
jgi:rod shape determining protein RodA